MPTSTAAPWRSPRPLGFVYLLCAVWVSQFVGVTAATEWSVPVAGNAFRTEPEPEARRGGMTRRGTIAWDDADSVFAIFFHVDRPASLQLAIHARVPEGGSTIACQIGDETRSATINSSDFARHDVGSFRVTQPGYVRVELRGVERTGESYGEIQDLVVTSETEALTLDYVKTNEGNMYYWGRRGPSVHLGYRVPTDRPIQYGYSEITVPIGQDPIGSYFMANGFAEGYFGIQVNGPEERRVLFSVWSPFQTDNPRDIPEDQRIVTLGQGPEVHVGEFGNEGSGGQSYLVYPWKAGVTYRFLTEVKPDGEGHTIYTSWFGDKAANEWRLIASFRRPKTDTHLRGFHSFLESFSPAHGYLGRRADYGNIWVRDIDGEWHECTEARFTVDATGNGRHRLDFAGGSVAEHFYLRNCGFFSDTGTPGTRFTRTSSAQHQPQIDLEALPRDRETHGSTR
jgi:hypothetical protein